ncbi:MAG: hypothetical protein AB1668_01350 [Nanoarchaeota archaeon]
MAIKNEKGPISNASISDLLKDTGVSERFQRGFNAGIYSGLSGLSKIDYLLGVLAEAAEGAIGEFGRRGDTERQEAAQMAYDRLKGEFSLHFRHGSGPISSEGKRPCHKACYGF